MTPPKINRNPNRGKFHAARMAQRPSGIGRQRVTRKYRPGVTIAARERGTERMIQRRIAAIQMHYAMS